MHRHTHFNLWLHDDDELGEHLGAAITERETMHQWPLSCVQRIHLADGRDIVYKSQYGPTVEPEFYRKARSPLLVAAETVWESDRHSAMLLDFVHAPLLQDVEMQEDEALRTAREIMAQLAEVEGDIPFAFDISGPSKWLQFVDSTLTDLQSLVDQGCFEETTTETVAILHKHSRDPEILEASAKDVGLLHGDLKGDNIFVCEEGYKLIDWQRPALGPTDLNFRILLRSFGIDPLQHLPKGLEGLGGFLLVPWLTECKKRWWTEGTIYDGMIAEAARKMESLFG